MGMLVGILSAENITRFISFQASYVQCEIKTDIIEVDSDVKKPEYRIKSSSESLSLKNN